MRALSSVAVTMVALIAAAPVQAQDDARARIAKKHFELGEALFAQGSYAKARSEFQKSHALTPRPELVYNIARCHELLGDSPAAIAHYRRFLVEYPDIKDRGDIEVRIRNLEARQRGDKPTAAAFAVEPPARSPRPASTPFYKRWWFWTIVGGVVAGGAVAAIAATTGGDARVAADTNGRFGPTTFASF